MLKRTALFLALCLTALISPWAAQAQNTQITASHIAYFGGTTVTGKFCVTPTNQAGQPITIVTPLGQQLSPQVPLCFPITSGVLSNTAIVPDTSLTQPVNACYSVAINDIFGRQIGLFPCVQPSGSTWSFDGYVPSSLPSIPALTMPQFMLNGSPNATQGYLDLICSSCTRSAGHITFPSASGSSNENLSFSSTPTFSLATTSSRIPLSGNITTFTLASGSDGQKKCLLFVHDATSTVFTVTAPGNVVGFTQPGSYASKRSQQCFTYYSTDAVWIGLPGEINQ